MVRLYPLMQSCDFNMVILVYCVSILVSFFTPCPSQTLAMALQLAGEFPARPLLNHHEVTSRDALGMGEAMVNGEVLDPMHRRMMTMVFLIGHPQRQLIEVDAHITIWN